MGELRAQLQPRLLRYVWIAPVLALAVGYASGHHPAPATSSTAAAANVPGSPVTLEYPGAWRQSALPAALAGLRLDRPLLLAPAGRAERGGLLAAALPQAGEPLPQALLAAIEGTPQGEAIWLVNAPAYRYARLSLRGTQVRLTAYSIAVGGGRFTLALCFAPVGGTQIRRSCEQTVESSAAAEAQSGPLDELQPQPAYARRLSATLGALQQLRAQTRRLMADGSTAARIAAAARRLVAGLQHARSQLTTPSAPAIAMRASTALERALGEAQLAYAALAVAAVQGQSSGFVAARERVDAAEARIHAALRGFGLLGYRVD